MGPENEQFDDLPQSLIDELKSADQPVPMITARVDREISEMARVQFSGRLQPAWMTRSGWAAIAATVLVALFMAQTQLPPAHDQNAVYADIDQSGQIDIADVLALARTRKPGEVTQAQLDAFAMKIVSLKPAGDSS